MSLQTMLKMSTSSENTSMQSQTPLSNGRRDDAMIKSCPFSHDALFKVDHIVNLGAVVDTFLEHTPDTVVNRIDVQGVRRPQRRRNKIRCLSR